MFDDLEPLTIISTLVQFFLMVLGVVMSLREEWAKRRSWTMIFLFVGLGLVGVVVTHLQSKNSAHELAQSRAKLDGAIADVKKSTEEISRVQSLNTKLQEQLLASNQTIAELAKQGIDTSTGGDSFATVSIQNHFPYLSVHNRGKFPLYGLTIRIVDLDELRKVQEHSGKRSQEAERATLGTPIRIGELTAGTAATINTRFAFNEADRRDFNIFFYARNGSWTQLLRLRKIEGNWIRAIRVEKYVGKSSKLLYEQIDKTFPRAKNGEIEWK